MLQPITGFHKDEHRHWVAELACGHSQHVRHRPPWELRPWVEKEDGRDGMLGHVLACRLCDEVQPCEQAKPVVSVISASYEVTAKRA